MEATSRRITRSAAARSGVVSTLSVTMGRRARALLESAGADVLYRETPMFHRIDPEFVREVAAWLRGVVPPATPE